MATQETWPEGVVARYVTVGGAVVTVMSEDDIATTRANCGGCGDESAVPWVTSDESRPGDADRKVQSWAQVHAEVCRALPRPEVA